MNNSKKIKYFFLSIIIFLLPFLDFLNDNKDEISFIIQKSFFFLIFIFLIVILCLSIFTNFFYKKIYFIELLLIFIIGFWLLFKHHSINNSLLSLQKKIFIFENFSSEISLLLIGIIFFLIFNIFLKKKEFYKKFIFIFFFLNFITVLFQLNLLGVNFNNENDLKKNQIIFPDLANNKKPNIYFFILDSMKPIKEFENYYKIDLSNFLSELEVKNYVYLNETLNLYDNTTFGLSAFFHLDKITSDNGELKINSSSMFPLILKENKNSNLINNLKNLGYEFKWIGNYFAYCPKFNVNYCIDQDQNIIDYYLNLSFIAKSPIIQIVHKLGEKFNFNIWNYVFTKSLGGGGIFELHDGIGRLQNYLENEKLNTSPTFYFIHHMSPHHPYLTDTNCLYKNFLGEINYEGYKAAYLCNLKKILNLVEFLDQQDPDSFIVFQSDHNWQLPEQGLKKNKIFNLFKKKNECTYDYDKHLNNVNMLRLILSCLTNNKPKYIEN